MVLVRGLIWDDWNRQHLAAHDVVPEEVEEVCHGRHTAVESYRKRLPLIGMTKQGRRLVVILSPEDRNLRPYGEGVYYVVTAFEEGDVL